MDTFTSEALRLGLKPPENATKAEVDEFRNAVDPDTMGFYGNEVGEFDGAN